VAGSLTPRRAAGLAGLVALAGGAVALNHNIVGVYYDDGLYAGLAWALGHGRGFVYPNLPGTPAAIHYPPAYPLMLAPLFGALSVPTAVFAGKVVNLLCAALATALLVWHAARQDLIGKGVTRWLAVVLGAAAAVAIPWLSILTTLMSEPLFALLTSIAVILGDRAPPELGSRGAALAAGATAAAASLVRTIGIALCVGVVVQVWRNTRSRGPRAAGIAVAWAASPCLVAAVGWAWWVRAHRGGLDPLLASDYGSYLSLLSTVSLGSVLRGLADLPRPLAVLTLNWAPNYFLYYLCGVPAIVVGVCGLWQLARTSVIGGTLVAYLAVLALWPVPPDRFLWAVLPWLAIAWATGAAAHWRATWWRTPVLALAAVLGFGFVRYQVRGFAGRWWERAGAQVAAEFPAVLAHVDSLPSDAVIATDHEPLVWLYTGRRAVPFYIYAIHGRTVFEPPVDVHRAYLERQGVTYVLAGGGDLRGSEELERLRDSYPGWLRLVGRWTDGRTLYAVQRAP